MKLLIIFNVLVFVLAAHFAAGLFWSWREDVVTLRNQLRAREIELYELKGRIETLERIGVEVRVVDTSAHANVLWAMEYAAAKDGE